MPRKWPGNLAGEPMKLKHLIDKDNILFLLVCIFIVIASVSSLLIHNIILWVVFIIILMVGLLALYIRLTKR